MSRLNLKLWTQVLHQLHELAPAGTPLPCKGTSCMTEHQQGRVFFGSALNTCSVAPADVGSGHDWTSASTYTCVCKMNLLR